MKDENDIKIEDIRIDHPDMPDVVVKKVRDWDDKDLAIISLAIIAIASMFIIPNSNDIVTNVVSGILGLATGVRLSGK